MAHRSEQGNVLGFVLVGALLVALLLGGIYVVRHTMSGNSGSEVVNNDTSSPSTSDESEKSDDQSLKDALKQQSSSNQQNSSPSTTDSHSNSSSSSSSTHADTLPETGPSETTAAIVGATLLVGAGVSYSRSRRLI